MPTVSVENLLLALACSSSRGCSWDTACTGGLVGVPLSPGASSSFSAFPQTRSFPVHGTIAHLVSGGQSSARGSRLTAGGPHSSVIHVPGLPPSLFRNGVKTAFFFNFILKELKVASVNGAMRTQCRWAWRTRGTGLEVEAHGPARWLEGPSESAMSPPGALAGPPGGSGGSRA